MIASVCQAAAQAATPEAAALLQIRSGFTNAASVLPDWGGADGPCLWSGIQCDSSTGKVVAIRLNHLGLQGSIVTAGWPTLQSLQVVDFWNNSLSGQIPGDWQLPSGVMWLSLRWNKFGGTLPRVWQLPGALQRLYLDTNLFVGSIDDLPPLPDTLQQLYLYTTKISGTIPGTWKLPTSLQLLYMWDNALTGPLPHQLQLPASLKQLDFFDNQLTGTWPQGWQLPEGLEMLYMRGNSMTGPLPSELPRGLKEVFFQNNKLSGTLPTWPGSTAQVPSSPDYYKQVGGDPRGAELPVPPDTLYKLRDGDLSSCAGQASPMTGVDPQSTLNEMFGLLKSVVSNQQRGQG
ncbi:hypothetical protein N2152v2_001937 [Parachlorella kessleri]